MRKVIIQICSVFLFINVQAQLPINSKRYVDSLQGLLHTTSSDTAKANVLFLLSDYWSSQDSAQAIRYASKALQLNKNNPFYTALAHFYIAGAYFDYDAEQSQKEYMYAEELLKNYTSPLAFQYRARLWNNYGALEQRKDNDKEFINILLNKAIPFAIKAGDDERVAINYMNVGMIFMNYAEYEKALKYYYNAIAILRKQSTMSTSLADCYINTAKASILNKNHIAAKIFLDSAMQILSPISVSPYFIDYYLAEGMYYSFLKQWKTAINSFNKGIALADQLNRPYEEIAILFEEFKIYKTQNRWEAARQILLRVYDKQKTMPLTKNKMQILYELSHAEAALNHIPQAYSWLLQYTQLSDSFFSQTTKRDIAALEAKYQAAKKEQEIATLQIKAQHQQLILERNKFFNYLLVVGFIMLLLALFIIYILYHNKQRRMQQQLKEHQQKLKEIEQEQQLNVFNGVLEGQELERNRIARDLHDGLGGMLAGIKLQLSTIVGKEQIQKQNTDLYKVIRQLDHSANELRRIARNMMPESLLHVGLEESLKDLCTSLQAVEKNISFEAYNISNNIPHSVQITIYRIVQELLNNALRHANASNIIVQCSQNKNMFFITVEDNGKGFHINAPENKKGIGLFNIKNRVDLLKGRLDIHSVIGEGTTVNIEVFING